MDGQRLRGRWSTRVTAWSLAILLFPDGPVLAESKDTSRRVHDALYYVKAPATNYWRSEVEDFLNSVADTVPYPEKNVYYSARQRLESLFTEGARGFGIGWLYVDGDGNPFVVTTIDVALGADEVSLQQYDPDALIPRCPIVHANIETGLAVIQIPRVSAPPRLKGLSLASSSVVAKGNSVWSAGLGGDSKPLTQLRLSAGRITGVAPMPSGIYLKHSDWVGDQLGGPLLLRPGAQVIGVNTAADERESTAISGEAVASALEQARAAVRVSADTESLLVALRRAAHQFADELRSFEPREETVSALISNEMVSLRTSDALRLIKERFVQKALSPRELRNLTQNPRELIRTTLFGSIRAAIRRGSQTAEVTFDGLYEADLVGTPPEKPVRTVFSVAGAQQEVSWIWQHGRWRIRSIAQDFGKSAGSLAAAAKPRQPVITAVASDSRGFRPSAPTPSPLVHRPNLYVVAVGVSAYQRSAFSLEFGAKDANAFGQFWARQEGGLYGRVTTRVLVDAGATRQKVVKALEWLQRETTQQDVAFILLAGHGLNDDNGRYYFGPHDMDPDSLMSSSLSFSDIKATLDSIRGKRILFLDTCHAGNVTGQLVMRAGRDPLSEAVRDLALAENGAIVFGASAARQQARESRELAGGIFTRAWLLGGGGGPDLTGDHVITVSELDVFVTERVKNLTGGHQSAVTTKFDKTLSDFPIVIVK
jgi:Caspase domain